MSVDCTYFNGIALVEPCLACAKRPRRHAPGMSAMIGRPNSSLAAISTVMTIVESFSVKEKNGYF